MEARFWAGTWMLAGTGALAGCAQTPVEPTTPAWADVAPIFRGECNSCHGWTAPQTGLGYRFDFFDVTTDVCGDAALALDKGLILASNPLAVMNIKTDIIPQGTSPWPRMPPQPSPALPDWEVDTIQRWTEAPVKGAPPPGNQPPTVELSNYPATANQSLSFTVVLDDPDGDAALGVIETNGLAFLMNRTGSFDVQFDSSTWPAGPQAVTAIVCDGWTNARYELGAVQIAHTATTASK